MLRHRVVISLIQSHVASKQRSMPSNLDDLVPGPLLLRTASAGAPICVSTLWNRGTFSTYYTAAQGGSQTHMHYAQTGLTHFQGQGMSGSYSPVRRYVSIICIKISCVSAAALSKEAYKVLKNKSRHSYLYVFTWKRREEKSNSFFPFFTTAKPLSFILHFEIERLWKDWNEAKANTGSKQEKTQVPFPIVEKTVSLSLHNKKGQICSSITSNLFHQLHPK